MPGTLCRIMLDPSSAPRTLIWTAGMEEAAHNPTVRHEIILTNSLNITCLM